MANTWPPLASAAPATRGTLTVDEWVALPEDENGEFIQGTLVEEEVPDAVHELAVAWLIRLIGAWLGERGFVFGSELKLLVKPNIGRKPDLAVFLPGTRPPRKRGAITEPPDVLIEVVTPTPRDERRDRVEKMADYATFGVRFYWLVDPALGTFEIFELDARGQYSKAVGQSAGVVDVVPGCPGLSVDLDALWRELARLADE